MIDEKFRESLDDYCLERDFSTILFERVLPYIGPQENRQYAPIILECTKEMIEELY